MLVDRIGAGTVTELKRLINAECKKAIPLIGDSVSLMEKKHLEEFVLILDRIGESLSSIGVDDHIDAMAVLLVVAHRYNLTYKIAEVEFKIEFECGIAEGFRFAIQSLANIMENASLYTTDGSPTLHLGVDKKKLDTVVQAFYDSPFSFNHCLSFVSESKSMMEEQPFLFPRKSRDGYTIGQQLSWDS